MESPLPQVPELRAGDRVHLIAPLVDVSTGTIGTVVLPFLRAQIYVVRFDGQTNVRLVDRRKLAPMATPLSHRS